MTESMKNALDFMISNEPNLQNRFYSVNSLPCEFGTVVTLANEEYVAFGDKQSSAVYLLDKGRNYKEIERNKAVDYWKDKIITFVFGFVSGVATTVIGALLINLISK